MTKSHLNTHSTQKTDKTLHYRAISYYHQYTGEREKRTNLFDFRFLVKLVVRDCWLVNFCWFFFIHLLSLSGISYVCVCVCACRWVINAHTYILQQFIQYLYKLMDFVWNSVEASIEIITHDEQKIKVK